MNNSNNKLNQVTAGVIQSPITGAYCRPRITKRDDGNFIYEEAEYRDPINNFFIKRVVLNTEKKK